MAFVTVVSVLAVREFYLLGAKQQIHPQFFAGYAMSILIALHYYFGPGNPLTIFRPGELMLIATVLVVLLELFRNKENSLSNISFTLAGIVYIPLLLGTMIGLRGIDPIDPTMGMKLTFCLFVGVWVCDSTAYFVGLNWGRHKLIERISPQENSGRWSGRSCCSFYLFLYHFQIWRSDISILHSRNSFIRLCCLQHHNWNYWSKRRLF